MTSCVALLIWAAIESIGSVIHEFNFLKNEQIAEKAGNGLEI